MSAAAQEHEGRARNSRRPALRHAEAMAAGLVLMLACLLPLLVSDYRLFQATLVLSNAIALLGLIMLIGYNGQISLGHGAFFALGAYTAAILMSKLGVPYYLAIPIAGVVCLVAGFLFGRPALRLEGHYLALATFALAVATPQFLKHKQLSDITGGVQGIVLAKPSPPIGLPISADAWLYWFTLAIGLVLLVLGRNMLRGRVGRALLAIRDHPIAAAAMGIDSSLFKSLTFAVSALYTGVAGAIGAIAVAFVSPDSFTPLLSIMLLVGVVVGGLTSLWGPLFGAIFLQFVPNLTDQISKSAPWAVYGALMIFCVFLLRQGIAGGIAQIWTRVTRRRGA